MLRRTLMGLDAGGRMDVAKAVAKKMGRLLSWGRGERKRQLERYAGAVAVLGVPEAVHEDAATV